MHPNITYYDYHTAAYNELLFDISTCKIQLYISVHGLIISSLVFPSESDNEDRQTIESGSSSSSSSLSSSLSSSEVHDSDSNNMEVDAGPAEEPSSSGIVNVPSNLLASHEAPVERGLHFFFKNDKNLEIIIIKKTHDLHH